MSKGVTKNSLGICVATRGQIGHVIGLAKAAQAAGKTVEVFFTGEGVHLTHDPRFQELVGTGKLSCCEVSYIANGYKGQQVQGLGFKDFVTQGRNAEMVEHCERYVVI
jgi:predicted peroxiredoxin